MHLRVREKPLVNTCRSLGGGTSCSQKQLVSSISILLLLKARRPVTPVLRPDEQDSLQEDAATQVSDNYHYVRSLCMIIIDL